jgi:hypothetical protein
VDAERDLELFQRKHAESRPKQCLSRDVLGVEVEFQTPRQARGTARHAVEFGRQGEA